MTCYVTKCIAGLSEKTSLEKIKKKKRNKHQHKIKEEETNQSDQIEKDDLNITISQLYSDQA